MRFSSNTVVNWPYFQLCLYYADTKCEPYTEHMIGCAMRQQGVCCSRLLSERVSHVHVHCSCLSKTLAARGVTCACACCSKRCQMWMCLRTLVQGVSRRHPPPPQICSGTPTPPTPPDTCDTGLLQLLPCANPPSAAKGLEKRNFRKGIGSDFERVEGRDNSVGQLNFLLSWMMTNWTLWEPWKFKIKIIFFSTVLGFGFILHIKEGLKRGRSNC